MAYQAWSVVFGEQPSASKWNILGTNDASFNDGSGIGDNAIIARHLSDGIVGSAEVATGVCVQQVSSLYSAVATGTTIIPLDDTLPQNTEGTEFMTATITPKSATNILEIDVTTFASNSAASNVIEALFQDSNANALAVNQGFQATATAPVVLRTLHTMVAGTTSATTFKIRLGGSSAGTITFNGQSGARQYSTATKSSIVIREYKAT